MNNLNQIETFLFVLQKCSLSLQSVKCVVDNVFELQSKFCWNRDFSYPDLIIILPGSCSFFFISLLPLDHKSLMHISMHEYLMTLGFQTETLLYVTMTESYGRC